MYPTPIPAALLARGFRPFFLAAALLAALAIPAWGVLLAAGAAPPGPFAPVAWHAHEMIFGYAVAVMAGFLLTAVRNWTGVDTPSGGPLAALVALWVAGRGALLLGDLLPAWLVAIVDASFLPVLAAVLASPLARTRSLRNAPFPIVLALLACANVGMHLHALGWDLVDDRAAYRFALDLVLLVMVLIGGRVTPMFTANALPGVRVRRSAAVDRAAVVLVLAVLVLRVAGAPGAWVGATALAAGIANGARLAGWRPLATRAVPILWILHLGYGWIVAALVLEGLALTVAPRLGSAAVHALTTGGIGALTLGMMSRVALGHTGRALVAAPATVLAYVLVNVAALVRVVPALALPAAWLPSLVLSSLLWSVGFGVYALSCWPVLTRPRVDGAPG